MKMDKIFLGLIISALLLALAACNSKLYKYNFRQERKNIEKVEICAYTHDYGGTGGIRVPLVELSGNEVDTLLTDILSIDCRNITFLDPVLSFGDVVISITYIDGEVEMLGLFNIGWITQEEGLTISNSQFILEEICGIISKYVDADVLSDVSAYFTTSASPVG